MHLTGCRGVCAWLVAAAACCLLAGIARAEKAPSNARLGKKIDNFTARDTEGKPFALYGLKEKKAIVVVFLSFDCPVSASYSQTLANLAKTYTDRGVAFVGVSCEPADEPDSLGKQVREFKVPFTVVHDPRSAAAEAFKADIYPEAFVLDHNYVLRYRGRIDNEYYARLKKNPQITRHDLRQALDELLAGKPVSEPVTRAIGCRIQGEQETKKTGKVTYYRDVLPILQNNCQRCHRPGEVGPFSLMTYRQAVNWSSDIKEFTR